MHSSSNSISKSSMVSAKKQHFHRQIRAQALSKYMKQLRVELIYQQNFQNLLKITEQSQYSITNENLSMLIHYANNSNDYAITHLSLLILNGIIPISVCQKYQLIFKDSFAWLNFFRICIQRQYCTMEMIQSALYFLGKSKLQHNILALTSCLQFLKILLRKGNEKILEQLTQEKLFLKIMTMTAFDQIKISNLSFSIIDLLFQNSQATNKIIQIFQFQYDDLKQMLNLGLNNDFLSQKAIKITNNIISSGYLNIVHSIIQKIIKLIFKMIPNIWNDQVGTQQSLLIVIQSLYLFETIFQNASIQAIMYYCDFGILNILLQNINFYLSKNIYAQFQNQSIISLRLKVSSMIYARFKQLLLKIMNQKQDYLKVVLGQIKKCNLLNYFYNQFQFVNWKKHCGFELQI